MDFCPQEVSKEEGGVREKPDDPLSHYPLLFTLS